MTNILKALFQHYKYIYQRLDQRGFISDITHGGDLYNSKFKLAPASIVIAFNLTFKDSKSLENL
jgi:hypothetical protein